MKLHAPLSGLIIPLELVPDQVFAEKMVGEGIGIEPTDSILYSPVDGKVEFIHPSKHAVTLKTKDQTEILIHIGIDTVQLKGEGFKSFVKNGDQVKQGDKLIEFDMDFVATQAKSLISVVLITQKENFSFHFETPQRVQANQSVLFTITHKENASQTTTTLSTKSFFASEPFSCPLVTGIHARPAAAIAQLAQKYDGDILIFKNDKSANAKSIVSLLALGAQKNDLLIIEAESSQAQKAVTSIQKLITEELESDHAQTQTDSPKASSMMNVPTPIKAKRTDANMFDGVTASPGSVYGCIRQLYSEDIVVAEQKSKTNLTAELNKISLAVETAQTELKQVLSQLTKKTDEEKVAIFKAHLEILNDPEIRKLTEEKIKSGYAAEFSWQQSINFLKSTLESLNNEVLAGRAHDLHDVGQRVLRLLLGLKNDKTSFALDQGQPLILVAKNLTPSQMAFLDPQIVQGICTVEGGASSHVAIIARSMGISYVAAVHEEALEIADHTEAILYAQKGRLQTNPSITEVDKIKTEIQQQSLQMTENKKQSQLKAVTVDGHQIDVFANVGKLTDATDALTFGAEGIGLLRSEFLFLHRTTAPTESEQLTKYQEIVSALNSDQQQRPVIIRTLDVGGDKPLSYLPMPKEENPFLGVRGLRLSLLSPELFRAQLRALLQVKPLSALQIMFPMVTTLSELIEAKKILKEECDKLSVAHVSVGIMIEVPSAALIAETLAPHVDFFSIGSNDLTQYTLAIDRGHRDLAKMADGLHPSILRLIKITCDAANKHKKMVGVCGGIAGDPQAVPLLIGLGVHELSVSVPVIPHIKAQIRKLKKSYSEQLAAKALQLSEASEVRQLITQDYL
jgi:phosphocarrier protein FPr